MSDGVDLDRAPILHRKASERYPIYTRANVAEIWPGPSTPLTYTTAAGMLFDLAWRKALVRFGAFNLDEFDPDHEVMLGVFYGYPYLNVSVQRVFGVRLPGATPDLIDASFFGTKEGVPPYEPDPRDESSEHTGRITRVIGEVLATTQIPRLEEDRQAVADLRAKRPDFAKMPDAALWQHAEPLITTWFASLMEEHMFITSAGAIPIGIVQATAAALGDPGLAMRALGGLGDVASAAPTFAMWELSRLVTSSPALTQEFDAGVPGVLGRLRESGHPAAAEFLRQLGDFLYDYGFRCPNEMDIGAPTWETKPEMALTAIERMRLQPDSVSPRLGQARLAADREQVVAEMLAGLGDDPQALGQLQAALAAAAVWLRAREESKFIHVRLIHEARMALLELGRRMVIAGVLDAPNDYVLLKLDEFPAFLAEPEAWAEEIRRRRRWFSALEELEPPFITRGVPPPPSQWRHRTVSHLPPATAGEKIAGIAACPGTATGTARVIFDPSECSALEPGDILIAPHTDPAWTPLFISAAAVVVDVGAPLSHAAIVSRELGVPCVVSATNASRRIPDGATVTVDGTAGTVTVDALP
jgi:phosphohistidine swiveling domain-containing protein